MHIEIDKYSHLNSPFHSWDPRFKIISFIILVLSVSTVKEIQLLAAIFILSIFLALISRIPAFHIINRAKFPLYFFSFALIFLPITSEGKVLFEFIGISYHYEGLILAVSIIFRGLSILILVIILFGTSPFDVTIRSLHSLKVPEALIDIILFSYRYIFQYLDNIRKLKIAMMLKGENKAFNLKKIQLYAGLIVTLLVRSYEQTETMMASMILRGYEGKHFIIHFEKYKFSDILKTAIFVILSISLIFIELSI